MSDGLFFYIQPQLCTRDLYIDPPRCTNLQAKEVALTYFAECYKASRSPFTSYTWSKMWPWHFTNVARLSLGLAAVCTDVVDSHYAIDKWAGLR